MVAPERVMRGNISYSPFDREHQGLVQPSEGVAAHEVTHESIEGVDSPRDEDVVANHLAFSGIHEVLERVKADSGLVDRIGVSAYISVVDRLSKISHQFAVDQATLAGAMNTLAPPQTQEGNNNI